MAAKFFCNICGEQKLVSFVGAAMVCDHCAPRLKAEIERTGRTGPSNAVLLALHLRSRKLTEVKCCCN